MQNQFDVTPQDSKLGWVIIGIIAVTAITALAACFYSDLSNGRIPLIQASRPGSVTLARLILSSGFGIAALVVGLKGWQDFRLSSAVVLGCMVLAMLITCSDWNTRGPFAYSRRGGSPLVLQMLIFLILPVIGFGLGSFIRMLVAPGDRRPLN